MPRVNGKLNARNRQKLDSQGRCLISVLKFTGDRGTIPTETTRLPTSTGLAEKPSLHEVKV